MAAETIEFFPGDVPVGELPRTLAWLNDREIRRIMELLAKARFVGGAVRDGLLGKETMDIDVATTRCPPAVLKLLEREFNVKPVGIKHGSVAVYLKNGYQVEITTLRKDVRSDGRHAEITFTESWLEDSGRRDFSINALYADTEGRVYDYRGGIDDLGKGLIRFIGRAEERINEDYLRILRFFRFFTLYGRGRPDTAGLLACRALAPNMRRLSRERIAQEMMKILHAPKADATVRLMADYDVLKHVWPDVARDGLNVLRQLAFIEDGGVVHPLVARDAVRRAAVIGPIPRWILKNDDRGRIAKIQSLSATSADAFESVYSNGVGLTVDRLLVRWARARINGRTDGAPYLSALDFIYANPAPQCPVRAADFPNLEGRELGGAISEAESSWLSSRSLALASPRIP